MTKLRSVLLPLLLVGALASCGQSAVPQAQGSLAATGSVASTDSTKTEVTFQVYQPSQLRQAVAEHPGIEQDLKSMNRWDEAVKNSQQSQLTAQGVPISINGTTCSGYVSTEFVPSGMVTNAVGVLSVTCGSGFVGASSTVEVVNQRDSSRVGTTMSWGPGTSFKHTAQRTRTLATFCTYASATIELTAGRIAYLSGMPYNGVDCK